MSSAAAIAALNERPLSRREARGTLVVVDIADMQVATGPTDVLVTYGLGSCIAVCVWDPTKSVGGMVHYMLPLSKGNPAKAEAKPAMFGDTGIPMLFRAMYDLGCRREDLIIKVAGGGSILDNEGFFNIGNRNHTIARKLLWKNGFMVTAEDVGGTKSRTVRLRVSDGYCVVQSRGEELEL